MNRNYGRLTDGMLKYAPDTIHEGDTWNVCPNAAAYAAAGWLPVVDRPPAEPAPEGKHWDSLGWQELDGKIRMMWELVDDPPAPPRRWTPYAIKCALEAAGKWVEVKAMIVSAGFWDEDFVIVQDIAEDNPKFAAAYEAACGIYGKEVVDALIDTIPTV